MGFASRRMQKKLVRKLKRMSSEDLAGWHVATEMILREREGDEGFLSLVSDRKDLLE